MLHILSIYNKLFDSFEIFFQRFNLLKEYTHLHMPTKLTHHLFIFVRKELSLVKNFAKYWDFPFKFQHFVKHVILTVDSLSARETFMNFATQYDSRQLCFLTLMLVRQVFYFNFLPKSLSDLIRHSYIGI